MAEDQETPEDGDEAPPKKGKGMLFGMIGAVVLGGAGFFASFSGMLPIGGGAAPEEEEAPMEVMVAEVQPVFVPIEDMVISLGAGANARHLQFGAQLEIEPPFIEEITNLKPRILDIINTYLRAVEERDIESPAAMTRLRAQMLRRVQIITGDGKVKDLLITQFVLN